MTTESLTYAALDFETANSSRASVCQIGVAIWERGVHAGTYSTLVQPPPAHATFHPQAVRIHGITATQVRHAPTWPEAIPRLVELIAGRPVFAHNASVERAVLTQASQAHAITSPDVDVHCTLTAARRYLPDLPKKNLPAVSAYFGIPMNNHHDAGADAYAAGTLIPHLMNVSGHDDLASFLHATYPGATKKTRGTLR